VGSPRSGLIDELDPISEWIIDVTPAQARLLLVPTHPDVGAGQREHEGVETGDGQGGVSLPSGPEVLLDAEVDLYGAAGKPATAS
jgi:hypothetical protein